MDRVWWCFGLLIALHGVGGAPVCAEEWSETSLLAREVAKREGVSESQAQREVDRVFAALRDELIRGRRVVVLGFGAFAVQERRARLKRGEATLGRAKKHLRFRAADSVVLELNGLGANPRIKPHHPAAN